MIKPVFARGILVCFVASLFCAYQLLIQGFPSIMVPELMEAFGLDVAGIGWLTSSFLYLFLIFHVPAGLVTDRVNLKWLLVVCSLLMSGTCYWFSVSELVWSAFLSRSLMGVIAAPGIITCLVLACRWMPEKCFPTMAGLVESVTMVGGGLGPLLLPNILEASGWQYTMKTVSWFGLVLAVLIICFVSNHPASENKAEDRKVHANDVEDNRREPVFSKTAFIQCCLFGFGMFAIISSFGGLWGVPFLYELYPGQEEMVGDIIGTMFVGVALGAPILGWLATKFGSSAGVMVASSILGTLFFTLLVFCPCSLMVLGIFCFFTGFFTGGYMLAF
ncbi:MAG: MFS transporter, partial [Endozoicomonas sp.]